MANNGTTATCAICGRKIKKSTRPGRPRTLCHRVRCKSIYMHNYMTTWWRMGGTGKKKEINLDRYDFSGNMEAGIYFL